MNVRPIPKLPSERYEPGKPQPVGFVNNPDDRHVSKSLEVLERLVDMANHRRPQVGSPMTVIFCPFRHNPLFPMSLFGFHIVELDPAGNWVDPWEQSRRLQYAVTLNLPTELQRESVLAFLFQLVGRQRVQIRVQQDEQAMRSIDLLSAESDAIAQEEVVNLLRYGWRHALEALHRRTDEVGLDLRVEFQQEVFPSRAQVASRVRPLRLVYNRISAVKESIDKVVSMIGGTEPRIVGGREDVRQWVQQHTGLVQLRQSMNQTVRDAEVCGNGFLAFTGTPPFSTYNLRPEEVEIREGEFYLVDGSHVNPIREHVLHLKGVEQIRSSYGVSLLEPFLQILFERDKMEEAQEAMEMILAHPQAEDSVKQRAAESSRLAKRILDNSDARVRKLLRFPLDHLEDSQEDLYFEGQEYFE